MALKPKIGSRILLIVVLVVLSILALFPIYWMINTSFTEVTTLFKKQSLINLEPTILGYQRLFRETAFGRYYLNSVIISALAICVALPISYSAAYSISRLRWWGQSVLKSLVLWVYIIPPIILVIPIYMTLGAMRLINTRIGLIFAFLTNSTPFCTWILIGYISGIPKELEDAALIDGCGRLQILYRIVLPVAAPGVITAGIYAFNLAWGLYLYPVVLMRTTKQLLAPGIMGLFTGDVYPWGAIMAAGLLACIVPVLLYAAGQRYVVRGLTLGAIK
jgi:multiple sugar transport system permease protein